MKTSQQNTLMVFRIYVCNVLLEPSRSRTSVVFCSPEEQRRNALHPLLISVTYKELCKCVGHRCRRGFKCRRKHREASEMMFF